MTLKLIFAAMLVEASSLFALREHMLQIAEEAVASDPGFRQRAKSVAAIYDELRRILPYEKLSLVDELDCAQTEMILMMRDGLFDFASGLAPDPENWQGKIREFVNVD